MSKGKTAGAALEIYCSLLLKRDALRKEGERLRTEYILKFGELLEERYALFIECIRYKKIIAFCLERLNSGQPVSRAELTYYIDNVMEEYYDALQALSEARRVKLEPISEMDVFRIKKLYRRLAMMLHPDLHPELRGDPEVKELWLKIRSAYERSDYEELAEAETLAAVLLKKKEGDDCDIDVEDIEGKIEALRNELAQIVREDPYLYKFLLGDDEAVESRKAELKSDIETYENYLKELKNEANTYWIEENA